MKKSPKYWRTQEDSNLWPLPSEGLCNDVNERFSVKTWLQTRFQAHVKPFFARIVTGLTPDVKLTFAATHAVQPIVPPCSGKHGDSGALLGVSGKTFGGVEWL